MKFLSITKPGIIFGNIITLAGGFFLATQGHIDLPLLLITMLSMSLIIGSGCVFNNCIDTDIDHLMQRTKNRPLVTGSIKKPTAILYGILLGFLGIALLYYFTNPLTTIIAVIGLIFYVIVYSLWLKRLSVYGTIIGGVAGAVPPVVGYCAVTNQFDMAAFLLFVILFTWQIPHFYAISIYRLEDFKAASIPILPVKKNIHYTKVSMLLYIIAFAVAAVLPTVFHYTGLAYFIVACAVSLIWFVMGVQGFFTHDEVRWARKTFLFSILTIMILCMMMLVKNH